MQIENQTWDIDKLIPYERNPRINDGAVEFVMASIKEFGFVNPIIVDKNGVIIAGHTRYQAAKRLKINQIPVRLITNLTPAQVKALRIADNKTSQYAQWDNTLLSLELEDLQMLDYDLAQTAFSIEEIEALLNPIVANEGNGDADECPELPTEPISKPGDLWVLGNHRLLCGDSTNPQHVKRLCHIYYADLMITDPPYGVNYDPAWRNSNDLGVANRATGKVQNDDIADWREAYSLFTGNVAYVWHAAKFTHIVAQNLIDCDMELISQIIWAKQHFVLSRGDYHWKHEPAWYAVKKGANHSWQGARDQATVWDIKNNNRFGNAEKEEVLGHGTQKPVECMLRPILNNSSAGEWVYDPFGGSGTTLIAAEKSGRRCLMMEIDPKYCDMIITRFRNFAGKEAILQKESS